MHLEETKNKIARNSTHLLIKDIKQNFKIQFSIYGDIAGQSSEQNMPNMPPKVTENTEFSIFLFGALHFDASSQAL